MTPPANDFSEIFKNPNPAQQELMDLIDSRIEDGMDRSDIEESLIGDMMDETPFHFCMSYALWKLESDREKEFDTLLEQKVAEMSSGNDSDSGTAPEDPAPPSRLSEKCIFGSR